LAGTGIATPRIAIRGDRGWGIIGPDNEHSVDVIGMMTGCQQEIMKEVRRSQIGFVEQIALR
jgi:hypothetical protein